MSKWVKINRDDHDKGGDMTFRNAFSVRAILVAIVMALLLLSISFKETDAYAPQQDCGGINAYYSYAVVVTERGCIGYNGYRAWVNWQTCKAQSIGIQVTDIREFAYTWYENGKRRLEIGCTFRKHLGAFGVGFWTSCWMSATVTVHGIIYNRRSSWC